MGAKPGDKGALGERLWVRILQRLGFTATREKRKQGGRGGGACDVVSKSHLFSWRSGDGRDWDITIPVPTIHWEVKNTKTLPPVGVRNALMQARATAEGGPCAVAMHIQGTSNWGIYFEIADWSPEDFGLQPTGTSSK